MDCDTARVGLSARLDDEDPGVSGLALDAHVRSCRPCQAWAAGAEEVTRRVRLRPADSPPGRDVAAEVLAAVRSGGVARPRVTVARLLLAVTALAQLALSLPALLLGDDVAASLHVAHEVGATEAALAIGVLCAAWRPWRAAGMLPVVAALALGLASTTIADVAGGEVPAVHELPHLLAVAEALLLWRMRRQPAAPPTSTTTPGVLRRVA